MCLLWKFAAVCGILLAVGADMDQCKEQCLEMCKEKPKKCATDDVGCTTADMCTILPYGYPWNPPVEPMYNWCKFSASVARSPGERKYVGVSVEWLYPNSTFYCGDHDHIVTSRPERASFETWYKHDGRRCSNEWQPSDCRSACKNWCRDACNCVWSKSGESPQYSRYALKNGWECVQSNAVCSVDCEMSNWVEWEPCSNPCDGGTQSRSRTIMQIELYGGKPCETGLTETRSCNTHKCPPIDCEMSNWVEWEPCSNTCDGGTQSRSRTIMQIELYGGKPCETGLTETRSCNTHNCPVDCEMDAWMEWGGCSTLLCSSGEQRRFRTVKWQGMYGGKECPASEQETRPCNTQECLVESGGRCSTGTESVNLKCLKEDETCLHADGKGSCTTANGCICRKVAADGVCSTSTTDTTLTCAEDDMTCLLNDGSATCGETTGDGCKCRKVASEGKCFATARKLECADATQSCIKNMTRTEPCERQNADCICAVLQYCYSTNDIFRNPRENRYGRRGILKMMIANTPLMINRVRVDWLAEGTGFGSGIGVYDYMWNEGSYEGIFQIFFQTYDSWDGGDTVETVVGEVLSFETCRYNPTVGDGCDEDKEDGWLTNMHCGYKKFLCCDEEVKL